MSNRIQNTERPYIEDILDKYCGIEGIIPLALGSSHWQPPSEALAKLTSDLTTRTTQVSAAASSIYSNVNEFAYCSFQFLPRLKTFLNTVMKRYGAIEGYEPLKLELKRNLATRGLSMDGMDIVITAGANQAFLNIAMMLCDHADHAGIENTRWI